MPIVRCPNCRNKVDTSFYGACLECGTLLPMTESEDGPTAPSTPEMEPQAIVYESIPDPIAEAKEAEIRRSRRGGMGAGLLIRVVLGVVVLGGSAIWGFFFDADRDASGEITDAGNLTANELRVGDCLDWPGSGSDEVETFSSVKAIPCAAAHDLEVYHLASYPAASDAAFPGDDAITEYGLDACHVAFADYVGEAWEMVPDLDYTLFWPTTESWDAGDRTIQCLLMHIDEGTKISGSLRGRDA